MAVTFRLLPQKGIVFVRYAGRTSPAEALESFTRYTQSDEFTPGQKHLIDLSGVTDLTTDYVGLIKLEAAKAFALAGHGVQTLMAYYAPTRETLEMARLSQRCWDGIDAVVPRVFQLENAALEFLGLRETCFEELMVRA